MEKDPQMHEPTPEAWEKLCGEFIGVNDEMVSLRSQTIIEALEELGMDPDIALAGLNVELGPEDQISEEAAMYLGLADTFVAEESVIGKEYTRAPGDTSTLIFATANTFCIDEYPTVDGVQTRLARIYRVIDNRLVELRFTVPTSDNPRSSLEIIDELPPEDIEQRELDFTEAQKIVRWLKVLRKYVGQDLYNRPYQPGDPA